MGGLNRAWHTRHPMPKSPSLAERVTWHLGHARACGCRAIPKTVIAELKRRGVAAPNRRSENGSPP